MFSGSNLMIYKLFQDTQKIGIIQYIESIQLSYNYERFTFLHSII